MRMAKELRFASHLQYYHRCAVLGGNDIAGGEDYDRPLPNFGTGSSNVTEINFRE